MDKQTVLIVDDNPAELEILQEAIGEVCGNLAVIPVSTGEECLAVLSRDRQPQTSIPDLILLDLNMPGPGGREVLAMIKNDPDFCHIPVIIFSNSSLEQDVFDAHRLYANSFVTKPMGYTNLKILVHELFRYWLEIARIPVTH